uniref:Uncharacterized protein n=1 Tax=Candidatus Kentrum sp. FM TaxID=2126340 RepID=A0A450VV64_9GAMM|nr:MAG: hypothetical protein BECKFM1743C_GA0114222_1001514 [Candidatus Kentron sp. FM]VFJ50376.1 MAG: hypothetical protein BECKFM1743A_GA0114220_100835 [Candidatus Kentron sp. FM]VFK08672.1 MAG: hypothetical protein BECKFM1743B_GA0114221_100786 [Candidatus Kentron sp. FM]
MNAQIPTMAEVNRKAETLLIQQLGVAQGVTNSLRFFNQFDRGQFNGGISDYTAERHRWLDGLSLDDIMRGIEENRKG